MTFRFLPFVLSVIAGATDTIGVLGLDGLFTAHITGNLVFLAARIVPGRPPTIAYMLAVLVFMLVLLATGAVARVIERTGWSSLQLLLLLQFLALAAFLLLSVAAGPWRDPDAVLAITAGMCGVAAMAVRKALAQIALKNTPTTAVMTTNVTHLMFDFAAMLVGSQAADIPKAKDRALNALPVAIGFAVGCALGAAGEAAVGLWSLMLPTVPAFVRLRYRDGARHRCTTRGF
jgi:uncharacterized membrane protein YoaK (UPF0700 family)